MQLSNSLSQFNDKNILLVVAGKQDAALYHVHDGSIDEVLKFVTPNPHYSDNEGIFSAAPNGVVHSGSVEHYQDEDIIRDFMHEFNDKIKTIKIDFSEIYLCAPSTSIKKVKEHFPQAWKEKVRIMHEGNYFKQSPLEILENLQKQGEHEFQAESKEEEKILNVPKQ